MTNLIFDGLLGDGVEEHGFEILIDVLLDKLLHVSNSSRKRERESMNMTNLSWRTGFHRHGDECREEGLIRVLLPGKLWWAGKISRHCNGRGGERKRRLSSPRALGGRDDDLFLGGWREKQESYGDDESGEETKRDVPIELRHCDGGKRRRRSGVIA